MSSLVVSSPDAAQAAKAGTGDAVHQISSGSDCGSASSSAYDLSSEPSALWSSYHHRRSSEGSSSFSSHSFHRASSEISTPNRNDPADISLGAYWPKTSDRSQLPLREWSDRLMEENEPRQVSNWSGHFDLNKEYLRDYRTSSNLDLHSRYQAITKSLDTTLTTANSVTKDEHLTTVLEEFLVDLEVWAYDIEIENKSLQAIECDEDLLRNVKVIFDVIEQKLALVDNIAQSREAISQLRTDGDSALINLEEAIPQLSSSLNILVHPIKGVRDIKSRRGQYAEIAMHMQTLAQQSRNEDAMPKTAKAVFDFVPENGASEKLAFQKGDEIEIMLEDAELKSGGWCKARIKGSTRVGLAPLDYLEKATSLLAQVAETTTELDLKGMEETCAGTQSNPRTVPQVPQQDSGDLGVVVGAVVGAVVGTYYGLQSSPLSVPRIQNQSSGSSGVVTSPYARTQSNSQMGPRIQYQSSGGYGVVNASYGTPSSSQEDGSFQHGDDNRTVMHETRLSDATLVPDPTHQEWDFFIVGRVFKARTFAPGVSAAFSSIVTQYGDHIWKDYSFIVVFPHTKEHWSYCLQITTYGDHAGTKKNIDQQKHAMIYIGKRPPPKLTGEEKMTNEPIKMIPIDETESFDARSRINLTKLHVIEHNIKIKEVGMISQSDITRLQAYCRGFMSLDVPSSSSGNAPTTKTRMSANSSWQKAGAQRLTDETHMGLAAAFNTGPPTEWHWDAQSMRYYGLVTEPDGTRTSIWAPLQASQSSSSNSPPTNRQTAANPGGQATSAQRITDEADTPNLEHAKLEQDSDSEDLDPSYDRVRPKDEWDFFVPGRVFKAMTIQEVAQGSGPSVIQYGDIYKKVYRFIVYKAFTREHWSRCVRISRYGGRGCTEPGLDQRKHTIVYTGAQPPTKLPGENRLIKDPIKIIPIDETERLDPLSRIDLAKTHVIEHNIRVKEVGMVSQRDLRKLQEYCKSYH